MKLDQHVGSKMGHVRSKTRSPDQILEKPCLCSIGQIFCSIIMKLNQHVCFYELSHIFENIYSRVKTKSLSQILEKLCIRGRGQILSPIFIKLDRNLCLDKIWDQAENGSCRVKN